VMVVEEPATALVPDLLPPPATVATTTAAMATTAMPAATGSQRGIPEEAFPGVGGGGTLDGSEG
jgi:hypothetical protein